MKQLYPSADGSGPPAFGQKSGILGESVLSFCRLIDLSGEPEWI